MCRFVAYAGEPLSPAPLVFGGSHSLYRQSFLPREMLSGSVNADGYGIGWYRDGRPVRVAEARPIWHDPDLRDLLSAVTSTNIVAFLRNATPGLPVDRAAVAPFLFERWSFGLNGFLANFRRSTMRTLHALLPDALYAELGGVSDSQALFLLVIARLQTGATATEALAQVVEIGLGAARDAGVSAQLNMVLSDGDDIVLSRTGSEEATNSLYLARGAALAPGGVVAASEPLDGESHWEAVPSHAMVCLVPGEEPDVMRL
ncbi:MAG: class II glutamine amidotransferase [Gemmatimonadota bacterium]